jgi:hypothetical protein
MSGNPTPIFSRVGDIQGSVLMLNPVATTNTGYTGADANAYVVYTADATNGGFVQRIRLKANNSNPANVVRFWLCNQYGHLPTTTTAPTSPATAVSATSGTMTPGTYFMKVQALDAFGQPGPFSTEVSNTVPATGNNITWSWSAPVTATQGVSSYRLVIGLATNQEQFAISNVSGLSYTQNTTFFVGQSGNQVGSFVGVTGNATATYTTSLIMNTTLIGEVSLPITTVSATASTVDIDYPINLPIPPGYRILAGLGTATANGIIATVIGGKY